MAKHSLEEAARSQLDPNFKSGIAIIDKIKNQIFSLLFAVLHRAVKAWDELENLSALECPWLIKQHNSFGRNVAAVVSRRQHCAEYDLTGNRIPDLRFQRQTRYQLMSGWYECEWVCFLSKVYFIGVFTQLKITTIYCTQNRWKFLNCKLVLCGFIDIRKIGLWNTFPHTFSPVL